MSRTRATCYSDADKTMRHEGYLSPNLIRPQDELKDIAKAAKTEQFHKVFRNGIPADTQRVQSQISGPGRWKSRESSPPTGRT